MVDHTNDHEYDLHQSACPSVDRLKLITACRDMEAKKKLYSKWASFYDEDMDVLGYQGYGVMGKRVTDLITDKEAKILDIGCGTGRFGLELHSLRYTNIHGVDGNNNFLEKSRKRHVYTNLKQCWFGANVISPYENGAFDIVVAVSSFGPLVLDHSALPEIDRLTRTGGYFILFIRKSSLEMEDEIFNVKSVFDEWIASGKWERLGDISSVYYSGTDDESEHDDRLVEHEGVIVTLRKQAIE
nr:methyltransferase-like protein 27 [Lytechinus pictus]